MQKQRAAVGQRELLHRAFEIDVLNLRLSRRRAADHLNERGQAEPRRAPHISTLVGDDREEPRPHRHPRPELVKLPPGARQRFLGGVLGVPPVPQHGEGEPQTRLEERPKQRLERSLVTGHRPQAKRLVSLQAQCVRHTQ